MTGARVLITGAGGFVGSHLAVGFAALGFQVTAQDMTFDPQTRSRLAGLDLLECDLSGSGVVRLPAADIIIHAAAITTDPQAMGWTGAAHITANIMPLLALLRHAAMVRPEAFVFLSSSGVFAESDGSPDLTDTDVPTGQGPYSAAKRAGEVLVPAALANVTRTYCLRLGYLYGPHEAARPTRMRVSVLQNWIDRARHGEVIDLPDPAPRRDWTYVPDLAPAVARIVQGPSEMRPRHLCAPNAIADTEVVDLLRHHFPALVTRDIPAAAYKAPMQASRFAALDGFAWTDLATGLHHVWAQAAAA